MKKNNKNKSVNFLIIDNSGFTLLEVVISLFIITMMVAVFLTNYDEGNRSNNLSLSEQQMVSDIRTAQNKALGSTMYGASFPPGGWGAHFDLAKPTSYVIFGDADGNKLYTISPDEALLSKGGQTVTLPTYVTIVSIKTNNLLNQYPSTLDVTYLPPDPITRIYGNGVNTSSVAYIGLKESVDSRYATVTVNILGFMQAN